jgi:membrane protein DedA with SNARE-associated domain
VIGAGGFIGLTFTYYVGRRTGDQHAAQVFEGFKFPRRRFDPG